MRSVIKFHSFLFLLCLLLTLVNFHIHLLLNITIYASLKVSGYLEIDLKLVEQLNDRTFFDYSNLKIRKVNKTRQVIGNVTYNIPLDDTFVSSISIYIKQGNQYRLMPYKLPKKPNSEFYNDDKIFYPEIAAVSDLPFPYPNPLPVVCIY